MAEWLGAARDAVQTISLQQQKEVLQLELQDRERKVEILGKSNGQLTAQVQQLKTMLKDAQGRYEGDRQRTVASLQDQYNSALELLQLGAGLAPPDQPKAEPNAPSRQSQPVSAATVPAGTSGASAGCCTGVQRPPCTRLPPQHPQRPAPAFAAPCKCHRAGSCRCPHAAAAPSTGCTKQATRQSEADPRLSLLGLGADDFAPSAAYGANMGLATEPLAVLRDVLNLDGSRDRERELQQQLPAERPLSAGPTAAPGVGVGPAGALLAQAQFESRLRGAYRSMLLQLQHRYQLERERQEDSHKLELQEQEARHIEELRQLAAAQEAELGRTVRRLERQEAAMGSEMQRLEAQLAAAKAAAETSHSQVSAAREAAESLQAQLHLQRTTHEAELQHVRQGCMPLQEHEDIVRKLQAGWEQALQQRERDYTALLSELAEMRRQLSTVEPSRSSGNSCGRGSSIISPLDIAAGGHAAATAANEDPAAPAQQHRSTRDPESPRDRHVERRLADDDRLQQQHARREDQTQHQQQHQHANEQHAQQQRHQQQYHSQNHEQQQRTTSGFAGVQYVPATTDGLRVRFEDAHGGGRGRPGSPAGSAASAARSADGEVGVGEAGSAVFDASGAEEEEGSASSTPRSRAKHCGQARGRRQPPGAADPPPTRPSSSSSRLSELVGAVVQYGSTAARRGLPATDGAAEYTVHQLATAAALVAATESDQPGMESRPFGGGSSAAGDSGGSGGALEHYLQQQQHTRRGWVSSSGAGNGGDVWGRGCAGGGGGAARGSGRCSQAPDSPDQHTSEITLDRWQREEPPPLPDGNVMGERGSRAATPSQRLHHSQGQGQGGGLGSTASLRGAADDPPQQQQPRTAGAAAAGIPIRGEAREGGAAAAMAAAAGVGRGIERARRGRSPSPPQTSPLRSGRAESSWGRSGNPAAVPLSLPRCIRCGLNDATSPGCCRFHPALLSQPGGLRFTPEWMTCQAADHTARTPGCFMRTEHFYDLGLMLQQQQPEAAAPAAAAARRQMGRQIPAMMMAQPTHGSVNGNEDDNDDDVGGGKFLSSRGAPALRADRRSSVSGAAAPPPATAAAESRKAPASPLRRAAPTRSPNRGAAGTRLPGFGGGRPGAGHGDSPSPKPRTRLPSPMRR